jgi:hypothetical protein
MSRKTALLVSAAALALTQASHAQESAQTPPSSGKPAMIWKIRCNELPTVPLTADAMQALPLQVVATMNCGDQVSVLSDGQGYTVNIRTADGATGYVASTNLIKALAPRPVARVAPVSAAVHNGVARWSSDAKGCNLSRADGAVVESLTANGVTVQVSLHDLATKLRANIVVDDISASNANLNPAGITLEAKGSHHKPLTALTSAQLAADFVAQPSVNSTGTVRASYKAPDATPEQAASNPGVVTALKQFNADSLKKTILQPDAKSVGAVWFERDHAPDQYVLRVPIDNLVFEFPVSLRQAR